MLNLLHCKHLLRKHCFLWRIFFIHMFCLSVFQHLSCGTISNTTHDKWLSGSPTQLLLEVGWGTWLDKWLSFQFNLTVAANQIKVKSEDRQFSKYSFIFCSCFWPCIKFHYALIIVWHSSSSWVMFNIVTHVVTTLLSDVENIAWNFSRITVVCCDKMRTSLPVDSNLTNGNNDAFEDMLEIDLDLQHVFKLRWDWFPSKWTIKCLPLHWHQLWTRSVPRIFRGQRYPPLISSFSMTPEAI